MNAKEWNRMLMYVPERDDDPGVDRRVAFHEMVVSFADISEQCLAAERNDRNKTRLLSICDACDQMIAATVDLLREIGVPPMRTRTLIDAEQKRVNDWHGVPAEREEGWTDFVLILAEELGEVAEAVQTDTTPEMSSVVAELVQVASVALTIRRVAAHRSGVDW